jgi:hypothetical protein
VDFAPSGRPSVALPAHRFRGHVRFRAVRALFRGNVGGLRPHALWGRCPHAPCGGLAFLKAAEEKAARKAAEDALISQQNAQIQNLIAGFTFEPL